MEAWERLEKDVTNRTGGRATPGSGRFNTKGDVRTDSLYIECKWRTESGKPKAIPGDWCRTAESNTRINGLTPVIAYQAYRDEAPTPVRYFCRLPDATLFDFVELGPEGWCEISAESVQEYCREERL